MTRRNSVGDMTRILRAAALGVALVAIVGACATNSRSDRTPVEPADLVFLGDHIRLRLSIGDGGEILAKRPAGIGTLPEPGGPVAIAWPEGAACAFQAVA